MKTNRTFMIISALILISITVLAWVFAPGTAPAFFNGLFMLILPLVLGAFIFKITKADWGLFRIGAFTFIFSQVLHIPFNSYILEPWISSMGLEFIPKSLDLVILALLYGLSAGVFEEVSRYIAYRKWASDKSSWSAGIMYGAGHGGVESILLGAIVLYTFFQMLALQSSTPESLVGTVPLNQVDLVAFQVQQYWASPWWMHLLGALERLFAITLHISMALLVQRAILRKQIRWFFAALLFHTLIDMVAVYMSFSYGALITEGVLFVLALISFYIIIRFRRDHQISLESQVGDQPPQQQLKPITKIKYEDDLISKVEESKYD